MINIKCKNIKKLIPKKLKHIKLNEIYIADLIRYSISGGYSVQLGVTSDTRHKVYAHYNNILKFLKYWEITEFMPVEMFDEEANILYNGIRLALRNRKIKNILHD